MPKQNLTDEQIAKQLFKSVSDLVSLYEAHPEAFVLADGKKFYSFRVFDPITFNAFGRRLNGALGVGGQRESCRCRFEADGDNIIAIYGGEYGVKTYSIIFTPSHKQYKDAKRAYIKAARLEMVD